jgi:hypothetical protein
VSCKSWCDKMTVTKMAWVEGDHLESETALVCMGVDIRDKSLQIFRVRLAARDRRRVRG